MNNKAQSRAAHSGLQVPPTPNPEGVLQHDVRCTDTIMDTAPVAYQSATTLSTPMHPMTIVKPRWGLGSDLTRTQGALRDPGLRCFTPLAWWMQAHLHRRTCEEQPRCQPEEHRPSGYGLTYKRQGNAPGIGLLSSPFGRRSYSLVCSAMSVNMAFSQKVVLYLRT